MSRHSDAKLNGKISTAFSFRNCNDRLFRPKKIIQSEKKLKTKRKYRELARRYIELRIY